MSAHAAHLRNGTKMGGVEFIDTMLKDGLWDAFHGYHMGNTAENVASKYQITREQQDAFALASQQKASAAQKAGRFKQEIAPVKIKTRKGEVEVSTMNTSVMTPAPSRWRGCGRRSPRMEP